MKRILKMDNLLLAAAGSLVFTALFFLVLFWSNPESPIYAFFFRAWHIQIVNTFLFGLAMIFIVFTYRRLMEEREITTYVDVNSLTIVNREKAREWLTNVPVKYQKTMGYRRLSEILRGFINQNEVIILNEELSKRDLEQFDRVNYFVSAIKNIIPVLGFLGTVLGLSLGMMSFPEYASQSANIENLKEILKEFAGSLSMAFDTTLLALGYSTILVIASALIKHHEISFVSHIDNMARDLIAKFKSKTVLNIQPQDNLETAFVRIASNFQERLNEGLEQVFQNWLENWERHAANPGITPGADPLQEDSNVESWVEALRQNNQELLVKLDEISSKLNRQPNYELIVKPAQNGAYHEQ